MSFSTQWYRVFSAEEQDKPAVQAAVMKHRELLDPLRAYLVKELDNLLKKEESPANYSAAGFSAQQADYIGQRRQLRSFVEMLTFDQEETK